MQKPVFFVNSLTRDNFATAIVEIAESAFESRHFESLRLAFSLGNRFEPTPQLRQLAIIVANKRWNLNEKQADYYKFEYFSPFRAEDWMKSFAGVIQLAAETVHNWEDLDRTNDNEDHTERVNDTLFFIEDLIRLIKVIGLNKRETLALWDVKHFYFLFRSCVQSFHQFHGRESAPTDLFV